MDQLTSQWLALGGTPMMEWMNYPDQRDYLASWNPYFRMTLHCLEVCGKRDLSISLAISRAF